MIRICGLHKRFGPKVIFDGIDLDIPEGETHVIIGRSGEGKSVLLKHLCGLLASDSGEIWINGRHLDTRNRQSLNWVRKHVSMVFQSAALFDSMTVRQNVGFYLDEEKRLPVEEIDRRTEKLLRLVNLPGSGPLMPAELSGGMRKRVGLARALAMQPEIILYDEPTTGLDPVTSDVINDLMIKVRKQAKVTAIVVTHDMKSALKVGDRISMLYRARLIFTGTPDELMKCRDPIVQQFVEGTADGPITNADQDHVTKSIERLTRGDSDAIQKLDIAP